MGVLNEDLKTVSNELNTDKQPTSSGKPESEIVISEEDLITKSTSGMDWTTSDLKNATADTTELLKNKDVSEPQTSWNWPTYTKMDEEKSREPDIWKTGDDRVRVKDPEKYGDRLKEVVDKTVEGVSKLTNDISIKAKSYAIKIKEKIIDTLYEPIDEKNLKDTQSKTPVPENNIEVQEKIMPEKEIEDNKTVYEKMNQPEIYTESKYFGRITDALEMENIISNTLMQGRIADAISPSTYRIISQFQNACCNKYGVEEGKAYFAEKLYEFGRTGKAPEAFVETKFLKINESELKKLGDILHGTYFPDKIVEKMNSEGRALEEKHKENFNVIGYTDDFRGEKDWNSRFGVEAYDADRLGYQIWENIVESKNRFIIIGEGKERVKDRCNISKNFDNLLKVRKLYGSEGQAEFGKDVFEFVLSNGKLVPDKWRERYLTTDTMLENLYNSFSEINFSGFYEKTKDGVIDSTEKRFKNIQEEINNLRKEVDPKFKEEQERQKEEERINGINKRLEELTRILNNQNELIMNVKKLFNGGRERGPETKNFEENLGDLEKIENDLEKIKRKIKNKGTNEEEKELLKKERGKLQKRQKEIEAMLEAKEIEDLKNWRTKADHWSNFINYTVNGEDKGIYLDNNRILSQRGNADGERASVTEGFLIRTVAEMQNIGTQGMSIDDKKEWGTIQQELDELLGSEVTSSEIVLNNLEQLPDLVNKIREKVGNGESATVSEELEKIQNCITEIRENNGTEPIEIADVVAKEDNMRIDLENWLGNRSGTIQYVVNGKKFGLDEKQERERLNETEDLRILEGTTLDDILVISTIDSMNLTSFAGSGAPTADLPNGKGTFEQEWVAAKETLEGLLDENLSLSWREQKSLKEVQKLAGEIQAKLRNNNPDIETEIQNLSSKINEIENNHHK